MSTVPTAAVTGRKAETQARILRAAMRLFAEHGYERTTIAAVASEAAVSRSAVFWHFGDKASLFTEASRQLLVPFVEELERNVERLDARQRVLELFSFYEAFVEKNRKTIETFVRWVLESPELRESLQGQLFWLHNTFARDVREALEEVIDDPAQAVAISSALVALLDGNLLLSFLDPDPQSRNSRQQGLQAITALLLGDGTRP